MSFRKLERFEKVVAEAKAEEAEAEKRRELKRTVRDVLPKRLKVPTRPRGRTSIGGFSRKEIHAIRAKAESYLEGDAGLRELEREVRHRAVTILLIDGVLGTEPWRAIGGGPHAGIIAANARMRYLDNAIRILDDMRRSLGKGGDENARLMEGVIVDAEVVKP